MADLDLSVPSHSQLSPSHEPEPSTPLTPSKKKQRQRASDTSSPTSPAATSEASTCMASPSFSFMLESDPASKLQRDGRASSAGSSDFDEQGGTQVQQLPATHEEMPHLDLNKPSTDVENTQALSYQGILSPRQQSGKRYHSGYLQHRVPKAAGLLKSWKRKYFRLREHGLVCYKTQDAATPLFEVNFTSNSVLQQDRNNGEQTSSSSTPKHNTAASDAFTDTSEKRRRTWTSSSSPLTLALKHVEITGHQTAAKAVEVPIIFKAEDEADYAAWTECIHFMIEAHKRTLLQVTEGTNAMPLPPTSTVNSMEELGTFDAFSTKYMLMKEIGEGSFSIVHRAVNRLTGRVCAVKCCKISQALKEEERLLRTLSHPNVVSLEGVYERDSNLHYVVMDYLKDGDLCDQLIERQHLPEPEARRIIRQVVEGLAYLHRRCVLHRDIKPENILIHGNMVKIADFGLAKQLEQPTTMLKRSCGTLEYAAPELLCGRPYGLKSDVFSLGIVLYVLLFGAFPFSVESAAALQCMDHFPTGVDVRDMSCLSLSNIQWRTVSPLAQDALLKMLETNDAERISAEDLLSHPWFDDVDVDTSSAEDLERVRIEDCEALGFAELLSRGFQAVKFGYKKSTTPHFTYLTFNFMEESVTWTARMNAMSTSKGAPGSSKRGRTIPLREITEIREGHSTEAFLSHKDSKSVPPPELCLSIICPWRTLDLVVDVPNQREFMVRGLRRLLPNHSP